MIVVYWFLRPAKPMRFERFIIPFLVSLLVITLSIASSAQERPKNRPKLKDFGSSLKRLKWDASTKQAVDTKRSTRSLTGSDNDEIVRIETNLVSTDVLVVDDKGKLVDNLTANDLMVTEDGEPQKIVHFGRGDTASIPRSIVLIIDYGCSQLAVLRRSIDAAKFMVDKLGPADVMAIVTDDVELVSDFTNDKNKLKKKLEEIYKRPNTAFDPTVVTNWHTWGKGLQFSALMVTLREAFIEEDLRPIIVFQTNGSELYEMRDSVVDKFPPPDFPGIVDAAWIQNVKRREKFVRDQGQSDFSLADVYRAADKSRATIYTIIPDARFLDRTPEQQLNLMRRKIDLEYERMLSYTTDYWRRKKLIATKEEWRTSSSPFLMWWAQQNSTTQAALASVAPRTGGWTEFLESPEDADGIYNRILADINNRYVVAYYPTNKAHDGTRRKIRFEVKGHPEYHILGRNSYYASEGSN